MVQGLYLPEFFYRSRPFTYIRLVFHRCVMLPKFNPKEVWHHLLATTSSSRITIFTGVPTMYVKLLEEYENSFSKKIKLVDFVKATCSQKVRLVLPSF